MKRNKESKIYYQLADNVRYLMEYHDLTQVDVAQKCGVSQRSISNLINIGKLFDDGKDINFSIVVKVAAGFGLSVSQLVSERLPVLIDRKENRGSKRLSEQLRRIIDIWDNLPDSERTNLAKMATMMSYLNPDIANDKSYQEWEKAKAKEAKARKKITHKRS